MSACLTIVTADQTVQREIRRYRAIRSVGGSAELCDQCAKILWRRAGEEHLGPDADADVLEALLSEAQTLKALSERVALTEFDRNRLGRAAERIHAAVGLIRGER